MCADNRVKMLMTLVAFTLLCVFRSGTSMGHNIIVTLAADCTSIRAYDPVFLKVTIRNEGDGPVVSRHPIGACFGSVSFYRTWPGHKSHRVNTKLQGMICVTSESWSLLPGEEYVAHELLFVDKPDLGANGFIFSQVGRQQIVARVAIGGSTLTSNCVTFDVQDRPDVERDKIVENQRLLWVVIDAHHVGSGLKPSVLSSFAAELGPSNLKATLEWNSAVFAAQRVDDQNLFQTRRDLKEIRRHCDPVINEIIALKMARYYAKSKDWNAAKSELSILKQRSDLRDGIYLEAEGSRGN
jgi:hypothetical protein